MVLARGPVAAWSIGGLEQPLIWRCWRGRCTGERLLEREHAGSFEASALPSSLLGLLCLTRPDGPLFVLAFAARAVRGTRGQPLSARMAAWLVAAAAFCMRAVAVPPPVLRRLGARTRTTRRAPSRSRARGGLATSTDGADARRVWLVVGDRGSVLFSRRSRAAAHRPARRRAIWTALCGRIGGDICPSAGTWCRWSGSPRSLYNLLAHAEHGRRYAQWVALGAGFCRSPLARDHAARRPGAHARAADMWHWTGEPVGNFLRNAFRSAAAVARSRCRRSAPVLLSPAEPGHVGLTTASSPPTRRPASAPDTRSRAWRRAPTCTRASPTWSRSGHRWAGEPDVAQRHRADAPARLRLVYRLVTFETDDAIAHARAALGAQPRQPHRHRARADRVVVPGYLLATTSNRSRRRMRRPPASAPPERPASLYRLRAAAPAAGRSSLEARAGDVASWQRRQAAGAGPMQRPLVLDGRRRNAHISLRARAPPEGPDSTCASSSSSAIATADPAP